MSRQGNRRGLASRAGPRFNALMSQSPPYTPGPLDDRVPSQSAQPAISTACVAALVCSLLVCIPILTQLLGLILGIVGIGYTSGEKARGRGLAVAALVISPLAALAWCAIAWIGVTLFVPMIGLGHRLQPLLTTDEATMSQAATSIHQTLFSERLKVRVDQAALLTYAQQVVGQYGPIKVIEPTNPMFTQREDDVGWVLHLKGTFAEGSADVSILIGLDGFKPQIDNITVGDRILAPEQ